MQCKAALKSLVLLLVIVSSTSGSRWHARSWKTASSLKMVELIKRYNAGLRQDIADLKRCVAALKEDNAALQQQVTELQENVTSCLDSCTQGPATPEPPLVTSSGGATYVRWGRTSCPEGTDLVYKGSAGGGNNVDSGSAVDYLCLPEDRLYSRNATTQQLAFVVGAKYGDDQNVFNNGGQSVPCAVCRSSTRSSAIMIPARTSCYSGFHLEYYGYLMTGKASDEAASEYVCVDKSPENVPEMSYGNTMKVFFFAMIRCGTLKCSPYEQGRPVTCVVCSK